MLAPHGGLGEDLNTWRRVMAPILRSGPLLRRGTSAEILRDLKRDARHIGGAICRGCFFFWTFGARWVSPKSQKMSSRCCCLDRKVSNFDADAHICMYIHLFIHIYIYTYIHTYIHNESWGSSITASFLGTYHWAMVQSVGRCAFNYILT